MRKRILIILSLIMMAVIVPISPVLSKAFAGTTAIDFDKTYSSSLTSDVHERIYRIELPTSGMLKVSGQTYIDSGAKLSLLDSEEKEIRFEYIYKSNRDYSMTIDLAAGTYYLRFYDSYDTGDFNFTATFTSANETYTYEDNYVSSLSGKDAIPFDEMIYGQLAVNDDADMYKIEIPASGELKISGQTYIDSYTNWSLFDDEENQINYGSIYASDRDYSITEDLTAGTYYLKFYDSYSTGNFNFTATFISANETYTYENNYVSSLTDKDAIPFGKMIYGHLARNDNTDMYKVEMASAGTLKISGQTYINRAYLAVQDSEDNRINYDYINSNDRDFSLTADLAAGIYYIQFYDSGNTGNYNFTATLASTSSEEVTPADQDSEAPALTVAAPKNLKLKAYKKAIKVTAKKRGKVSGYQIRYKAKSGKWKKTTVKTGKNLSKKLKNLKAKKKYYVKVRAFYKHDGITTYSKWTKTKSVKTK